MEYTFQCGGPKEANIGELVNWCFTLEPNDHLVVFDFGDRGDLRLDIFKDEDYDRERGEYNMVVVHTSQMQKNGDMVYVDDTDDVYVGNGELDRELVRIWRYENFALAS